MLGFGLLTGVFNESGAGAGADPTGFPNTSSLIFAARRIAKVRSRDHPISCTDLPFLANFNPHLHVLATNGAFLPDG